ncbi:CvpA family protein [Blastopirellula marina]|uniref:Colicin V production protein n=1 Tax=Blastopirellula marina TaxID=124 RepID=A0A2S8GE91_9BACT|nr:CvpA family protein [Blastopirellula marina]PQO42775.1 hypothetical protein C5Y98_01070 [Blastopirellula marina]PTL46541.1 CvpA family protein [Blastopirellula marina]
MVTYDFIMLAILTGAVLWGLYKGMAWQIASIASLVVSYFVSMQFREQVATALGLQPPWGNLAAMLGIYIGTSLVIWVAFSLVKKTLDNWALKDWDRQVGAGIGFAKGVLLCIIVTMFAVAMTKDASRQQIVQSKSGYYITKTIHVLHGVMPAEVNEVVGPFVERYDQRINGQNPDWFADTESGSGGGGNSAFDPANFNLQQEFQDFKSNVQNKIQDRFQNEVQNQAGQVQNFVNETIENPQNIQSNWQQYTGQYQQPQQGYVPPAMNVPTTQQPGGNYVPQYGQPPQPGPYSPQR